MWNVPADMLTLIHHNELIMPAAQAGAFRDMLSGGGAVGGDVHLHYAPNMQAFDATGVAAVVEAHGRAFAAHVADQWTRNRSLRPAY